MNLIELLEGYQLASARLKLMNAKGVDEGYIFISAICDVRFTKDQLKKALLQYRRENNIYEVDDMVGRKMSNDIFIIKEIGSSYAMLDDGDLVGIGELKHATDKEIKKKKLSQHFPCCGTGIPGCPVCGICW